MARRKKKWRNKRNEETYCLRNETHHHQRGQHRFDRPESNRSKLSYYYCCILGCTTSITI